MKKEMNQIYRDLNRMYKYIIEGLRIGENSRQKHFQLWGAQ